MHRWILSFWIGSFTWTIWTNQFSSKRIRCSSAKFDRGDTWSQVSLVSHLKQLFSIMVKITLHLVSLSPTLTQFKWKCIKTCRFFHENQHRIDEKGQQIPSDAASAEWLILVSLQETHAAFSSDWRLDVSESWASHLKIPSCSQIQILHNYP